MKTIRKTVNKIDLLTKDNIYSLEFHNMTQEQEDQKS